MIKTKKKIFIIIGYGSIGRKHHLILKSKYKQIDCIIFKNKKTFDIKKINIEDNNFFFICTPSNTHIFYLKKLIKFKNSYFFVEKPIIDNFLNLQKINISNINLNKVMIGYVFRHNQLLDKFKKIINKIKDKPILVTIECLSYLPNWRKNSDYTKSVTALKSKGGGIYNELSHEIDYMIWFFGKPDSVFAVENNSGNLKLKIAETSSIIFIYKKKYTINMNLSFNSKISKRYCEIKFLNYALKLDILSNKILKTKSNKTKEIIYSKAKELMYHNQIKNFLNLPINKSKQFNNFNDSILVTKIINKIEQSINFKKIINI